MKKAVIIGCGNIGFATIQRLTSEGYEIVAFDLREPEYLTSFIKTNQNVSYRPVNASDEISVYKAFSVFSKNEIDLVVSTVGLSVQCSPISDYDTYAKVIDINVFGNIIPIKCLVNNGYVRSGSRIVVIGSTSGHFAGIDLNPYAVSKWILVNVCSSLNIELQSRGISLEVVNPRSIKNVHSDVFKSSNGVGVDSVVNQVVNGGGYQSFIPKYYSIFHFLERCCSWTFDLAVGLKPHFFRKRNYKDKIESVMITGASSGLGASLAKRYAGSCNELFLVARSIQKLDQMKLELESKYQCKVNTIKADLSDNNSISQILSAIQDKKIDLLVNNAGYQVQGSVLDVDTETYRESILVNCLSHIHLTSELLKRDDKPLCIANVMSTTAVSGRRNLAVYSSPKAGLWAWTKVLRRHYGKATNVIEVIPATFKSSLGSKGIKVQSSGGDENDTKNKSIISSSKYGYDSDDVSAIIYNGIKKRKDKIFIPSAKVKIFIMIEAICPGLFRKMFS